MSDDEFAHPNDERTSAKLNPAFVRHTLHHTYAAAAIVLMITGLFLTMPDLRAHLIGGYGREILDVHLWVGWMYLAIPPIAFLLAPRALLVELRERLYRNLKRPWPRFHMVSVLVAGFLLGSTGVILWWEPLLPRAVEDLVSNTHELLTWFVIAELGIHLIAARRKTFERTRSLLGFRRPEGSESPEDDLFEFTDDE